ncbi:hypothetical protein HanRHA438_Chr03g0105101 [Helianthus annuus]|nr:hypothetical protein HanRHA438_Chr03g0105101 [Helianthus annuus]
MCGILHLLAYLTLLYKGGNIRLQIRPTEGCSQTVNGRLDSRMAAYGRRMVFVEKKRTNLVTSWNE